MSAKWSWIFGIATAASFIFAIIFFAATQAITARDVGALCIGLVFGATLSAFVATFVFHSEVRARRIGQEKAVLARKLKMIDALPTRREELSRLAALIASLDEQAARKDGLKRAMSVKAVESAEQGFAADAASEEGESNAALHAAVGLRAERQVAIAEQARLKEMSDDAFLTELKRLRGLE